jgi:hypothetical protein
VLWQEGGGYLHAQKWDFPRWQTASVVSSQRVSESLYAARVALLFSAKMLSHDSNRVISAAFSGGGTAIIARSHVGRIGCLSYKRNGVFDQESLNQLRHEFRGHCPQGQIIDQNGMYRTNAYPHLIRKFSDGDTTALHDQSPHLVNELVISACWEPTRTSVALHWCAAIFESVVKLLNLCDAHAIVAKTHWIFRTVSTWLSPSFWQSLMQYRCSSRSVIFAKCDARSVYTLSHMLAARGWCCLLEWKNPRMHKKVPSTLVPKHNSHSSLVSAEKNHVRYFLIFPRNINHLTPNVYFSGRTATLTYRCWILYIYSTNIRTEYFKHAAHSPFFSSSKCHLFNNATFFGFLYYSHFIYRVC